MTKLIYLTHPAVNIDSQTPIDQWSLSDKGWEQAKQSLELDFWKSVDVLYASTELKAYSMADMIANEYNIPFDDAHKIYDLGETRGRTFIPPDQFEEAVKEWYQDLDHNIHGWEPINEMFKRVGVCIDRLMANHHDKTVAIVGHGGSGTMVKCHIMGITPRRNDDPHEVAGGYFIADWDNKRIAQDWKRYWK